MFMVFIDDATERLVQLHFMEVREPRRRVKIPVAIYQTTQTVSRTPCTGENIIKSKRKEKEIELN